MYPQRPRTLDERRKHRRYPVWFEASLRPAENDGAVHVTLIDLSGGGALVHTAEDGLAPGLVVVLHVEEADPGLPARVLRSEREWDGTLYHLEFTFMDDPERAGLRELLERCRPSFEAHQRRLASAGRRTLKRSDEFPASDE